MDKAILCVDDEKSILDSLKGQLKRNLGHDFIIEQAEDAKEAMEVLEELMLEQDIQVVVIVSDWLMPDIKGDEFLTEVHARWPGIKKILLTGHANVDAVQRLTNNDSLYAMLQKPWQEDELINTIQSGL
ncbi:MAG: hypothetical protein CMN76_09420 [Spirochaetaceae bacterium]|nr:hypothetical protein [Spirochaetaceae bacterium]|tara:strand:+ start:46913 stop:47299 length:387 start_codon:yes stop_codon:yes gene_type:complete